jgi:hypothetical protein
VSPAGKVSQINSNISQTPREIQQSHLAHLLFLSAPEEAPPNLPAGVNSKLAFGRG